MPATNLIGISTLPNQQHKITSRKGASFTLMVVGESGSGKTTFINTLFLTLLKNHKNNNDRFKSQIKKTVNIDIARFELEEKGFNLKLTVIDTPGFGDYVNNGDCWKPLVGFIDQQHEAYLTSETLNERKQAGDLRVHACLYFIQPTGHTLKPMDIHVMKQLGDRVNLIPIIAKADTLTPSAMAEFKKQIKECIQANNINVFIPNPIESNEKPTDVVYSVIGADKEIVVDGQKVRGRQYLWGVAQIENEEHCDFKKLRNILIRTHMHDLIESTDEIHYENFRTKRLIAQGKSDDDPNVRARKAFEMKMKDEEAQLRKRFTEEVRKEEQRFKVWEQKLISERDRLNKDLENEHKALKALQEEFEELLRARKG